MDSIISVLGSEFKMLTHSKFIADEKTYAGHLKHELRESCILAAVRHIQLTVFEIHGHFHFCPHVGGSHLGANKKTFPASCSSTQNAAATVRGFELWP